MWGQLSNVARCRRTNVHPQELRPLLPGHGYGVPGQRAVLPAGAGVHVAAYLIYVCRTAASFAPVRSRAAASSLKPRIQGGPGIKDLSASKDEVRPDATPKTAPFGQATAA
jgi:hypothetical protein